MFTKSRGYFCKVQQSTLIVLKILRNVTQNLWLPSRIKENLICYCYAIDDAQTLFFLMVAETIKLASQKKVGAWNYYD